MKEFNIGVTRIGYASKTISVYTDTEAEAVNTAMEIAGNLEFSEQTAEYSAPGNLSGEDQRHEQFIRMLDHNRELSSFLRETVKAIQSGNLRELLKSVKGEEYGSRVDTAKPQEWVHTMRDECNYSPEYFVWDYNGNSIGGEPFNVAAAVIRRAFNICNNVKIEEHEQN